MKAIDMQLISREEKKRIVLARLSDGGYTNKLVEGLSFESLDRITQAVLIGEELQLSAAPEVTAITAITNGNGANVGTKTFVVERKPKVKATKVEFHPKAIIQKKVYKTMLGMPNATVTAAVIAARSKLDANAVYGTLRELMGRGIIRRIDGTSRFNPHKFKLA